MKFFRYIKKNFLFLIFINFSQNRSSWQKTGQEKNLPVRSSQRTIWRPGVLSWPENLEWDIQPLSWLWAVQVMWSGMPGGKTSDEKETCSQIDLLTKRCNILLIFDRRKSFCFCFNSGSNSLFSLINIWINIQVFYLTFNNS